MKFDFEKIAAEIEAATARKWNARHFSGLGELVDEKFDPDVVFRNNWLAKGQAFGLVAGSGIGKSSLTVQLAYHWAFGQKMLAEPMRNLKIAIIQAEDSDRDLKEQRDGMIRGLTEFEGWTADEIAEADANIVVPNDFIGKSGPEFINLLRDFQGDTHQDLLFINPLQSFFGGDVSSQEDAYEFANGIDSIIKHEELKCTSGIVMHTPKWKSGQRDGRQDVSDFAEYMMAGSHAWTDWLRAIFAFQKHGDSELYFDFKAAKRGKRLGWTDANGNPTTSKLFKHSEGFVYWQEVTDAAEIAGISTKTESHGGRGRPKKTELEPRQTAAIWATNYGEHIDGHDLTEVFAHFRNDLGSDYSAESVRAVVDFLANNAADFGFEIEVKKCRGRRGQQVIFHRHQEG